MNNNNNIIIRKIPKISNEFFQYIQKKIRSNFSLLYENECVVLFTFRILPDIYQNILLRILNLNPLGNYEFKKEDLFINDLLSDYQQENSHQLIRTLLEIQIFQFNNNKDSYKINDNFSKNLKKIIKDGITRMNINFKKKKNFNNSVNKGIKILHKTMETIFNLNETNIFSIEDEFIKILVKKRLIKKENNKYKLEANGLKCLINGYYYQIRNLAGFYIDNITDSDLKAKVIKLILNLYTLDIEMFDKLPNEFDNEFFYQKLELFSNLGIICVKTIKENNNNIINNGNINNEKKYYYVTPLIKCLSEDIIFNIEGNNNGKFLIIETNFKIYAYTKNSLDIKIFKFLFEVEYIFDGFIQGYISRECLRKLFKMGIQSHEILNYLSNHSSDKCNDYCNIKGVKYKIPENVAHQIIMWGDEITVLNPENVLLLYDFIDDNQYDGYMEKLKNIEIIWTDKKNRLIAVKKKYENYIKREFQNQ